MRVLTRLLALVHLIVGVVGSMIAVPFIGIALVNDPTGNPALLSDGRTFVLLFLLYFAPSIVGGIGLLFGQVWGRSLLLIQALAYLFLWPLGTALGAAGLALLLPQHYAAQPTSNRAEPSGPPQWQHGLQRSLLLLLAIASVLSAFDIVLTLAFRYNEDYVPAPLELAFFPSIVVFPLASLLLLRVIGRPNMALRTPSKPPERRRPRKLKLSSGDKARIARLEADPATHKYGQMIRAGQHWRDEAIAYDLDPLALASCIHLQPVERAMRKAGVPMRLGFDALQGDCCVDPMGLGEMFDLASGPISYVTIPGDRPYDPEGAVLFCRDHPRVRIFVIHPDEAPAQTPWFPSAPQPAA